MDIDQRISPTPFSEEEVSARGMSTSEKKAVQIGSHRSSPNANKFKVYLAKKKVQNNEYNELLQKPMMPPRQRVDAMSG